MASFLLSSVYSFYMIEKNLIISVKFNFAEQVTATFAYLAGDSCTRMFQCHFLRNIYCMET